MLIILLAESHKEFTELIEKHNASLRPYKTDPGCKYISEKEPGLIIAREIGEIHMGIDGYTIISYL